MSEISYKYRFLARVVLEAKTPLAIGSGKEDIFTDALVATDVNGLPYIPGTSIAGVLRSMIGDKQTEPFFGFKGIKGKGGKGSKVIFTEAKILNSQGEIVDGLKLDAFEDSLLTNYKELPIRQHVRMNSKGTGEDKGKFDEQVVFAGTRFCFEIEFLSEDDADEANFKAILSCINKNTFRLGSGSRSGFGEIEVVEIKTLILNLSNATDLQAYLEKSSDLSKDFAQWKDNDKESVADENWTTYEITLKPNDFFNFSSGFGDEEADSVPVVARKVEWANGEGKLSEPKTLIPASSVKGALAHRVAFHYNKLKKCYAGGTGNNAPKVGGENFAVRALFGYSDSKTQERGNMLFSDIIKEKRFEEKIINHVSIDRFTGGGIDGALFSEKATYAKGEEIKFTVLLNKCVTDTDVIVAWENTLNDLCHSMLPLGGAVNKGYGMFTGNWTKK